MFEKLEILGQKWKINQSVQFIDYKTIDFVSRSFLKFLICLNTVGEISKEFSCFGHNLKISKMYSKNERKKNRSRVGYGGYFQH